MVFKNLKKHPKKIALLCVLAVSLPVLLYFLSVRQNTTTQAALNDLLEAEDATVKTGNFAVITDAEASADKYVRFNSLSTPTPTQKPLTPTNIPPTATKAPTTTPTRTPTPTPGRNISKMFGVAVSTSSLSNYGNHIKQYGHSWLVPANVMKMQTIGGCNGNYNFGPSDQILSWANSNGMQMHGHTLVWHSQTSSCAGSYSKTALKNYIQTVMKHYCGKIYSMDVVNEALADGGGYRTGSVWYKLYGGPGYIEDSFRWAREACPSMKLYYNDYSIETYGQAKTTSMLNLVKDLKNKGLIDGVGFQAHWTRSFDKNAWGRTMDEVAKLGLEFAISEIDVRFTKNYWDFTTADHNLQAQTYNNAAQLCKDRAKCHHFIVWGVHDGDSWINNNPAFGNVQDAPLLFDRQLKPKPAYCQGVRPVFGLPKGACP